MSEVENKILDMFDKGYFTYEIALILDISEWDVDKVLWKYRRKKSW
jgi:DNA-binding CsgD family transcriptional regulator